MLDALPLAVQQMTLRFAELERERFLYQAQMAEEIICDLRGPYVKKLIGLRQSQPAYPVERTATPEIIDQEGDLGEAALSEGMRQDMLITSDGQDLFFDNIYARLLCAPTENVFAQKHAPLFNELG